MANENGQQVWVSVGITKNLGNYESARIDAGARIQVDDIEDSEAWTRAWKTVEDQVEARLLEIAEGL